MQRFLIFVIALVVVQQAIAIRIFGYQWRWRRTPRCSRMFEVYNECGSACPPTCDNYENPPICTRECVLGCQCINGFVRNTEDNSCCLPSQCPVVQPEPEPEPTNCPANEVYKECGSACPPTCDNYNTPIACTRQCVQECQCVDGYVRNTDDNICCLPSQCPAVQPEPEPEPTNCPANEVYKECGSACPPTCDNYNTPIACTLQCVPECQCADGYVRNTDDNTCCLPSQCPVQPEPEPEPTNCPANEVYKECGSACPPTCDNYNTEIMCTDQCVPECQCVDGYVRNTDDKSCCLPSQCPAAQPEPEPAPKPVPAPEPTVCPANQVYNSCGTACPLTCANYKNPPQMCTMQCKIGCECVSGYVEKGDGSCCKPEEC